MQSYTEILDTETLTASRALLLANDKTALSCSSGTAFPTLNLQVGMLCLRTDESKLYQLTALTPTWKFLLDLSGTNASVNTLEWSSSVKNNGGTEGGRVQLTLPASGSTLAGPVTLDTQANIFRMYEGGGTNRGAFIDFTTCAASTASKIWHSDNDGTGSTLDADLLDGQEGSYYRSATNINSGTLAVARGGTGATATTGTGSNVLSASPALTGTPTVPTAAGGTNTTQAASTAFVSNAIGAYVPLAGGVTATGACTYSSASMALGASGGITRGYLWNDSDGIGFLNSSGNWNLRVDYGTTNVSVLGNLNVGVAGANTISALNVPKAWCNFYTTGTPDVYKSFNIISLTDNGVGDITFTFSIAMPNIDYTVTGSARLLSTGSNGTISPLPGTIGIRSTAKTTSACRLRIVSTADALFDTDDGSVVMFARA